MKMIAQGAEAKLFKDGKELIKDRVTKGYRIEFLDKALRKRRSKKEAKILAKLGELGLSPKLIEHENHKITMEYIDGITLRDYINKKNYKDLMKELGEKVATIHNNGIIHGDLTTSNFICKKKIFFIDFGLTFESIEVEHKAVDLHLLRQALESKHYEIWEDAYKIFLNSYQKKCKEGKEVLKRLEQVEKRGRYKHK
jgi:Kae1-associated kinase Bud32|tara:strand:+ start:1379 stop:1969 length:591 start_codon:yes stop_codon:yes gene_type:complete